MSLRTTALVAGVIGMLLLAAGLIADSQRPPTDVTASARIDTAIVVYEPEMIAFAGTSRIGVSGTGELVALTARPVDAAAWLATRSATEVTGLPSWQKLSTDSLEPPAPSPSPSPSASASPEPAADPSPSSSPSPSGEEGEQADAEEVNILAETSRDHWRSERRGDGRLALLAHEVPPGETLVVMSVDGSPLTSTDIRLTRTVDDGWIAPLIWWGAFLTAVGIIGLGLRFIDLRPAHAKREEWLAKRQRAGDDDPYPDPESRRARRAKGEHLPDATLDDDALHPRSPGSSEPRDYPREDRP